VTRACREHSISTPGRGILSCIFYYFYFLNICKERELYIKRSHLDLKTCNLFQSGTNNLVAVIRQYDKFRRLRGDMIETYKVLFGTYYTSVSPEIPIPHLKIDWIITGHHKNLDTIGKQNYQQPGVEAELNFEFFEFIIIPSK